MDGGILGQFAASVKFSAHQFDPTEKGDLESDCGGGDLGVDPDPALKGLSAVVRNGPRRFGALPKFENGLKDR